MAKQPLSEQATDGKDCKEVDVFDIHCKLIALAALVVGLHTRGCVPDSNECYGISLFLEDIAHEIDPSQREEEA